MNDDLDYLDECFDSIFICSKTKLVYLNPASYQFLKKESLELITKQQRLPDIEDLHLNQYSLIYLMSTVNEQNPAYHGYVNMMVDNAKVSCEVRVKSIQYRGEPAVFITMRKAVPSTIELITTTRYESQPMDFFNDLVLLVLNEVIVEVNEPGVSILGARSKEEIIGKHIHTFIHPYFRDICRSRIQRVLEHGEVVENMEQLLLKVDGSEFEGEVVGYPVDLGAVRLLKVRIRDISDRKRAERRLIEAKSRYESLVQNSIHGITIVQDGYWVFLNQSATQLFEAASHEELLGRHIHELMHPDYHQECYETINLILSENAIQERLERKWFSLKGKLLHTEVVATPIVYGNRPAIQIIIQDISERVQSEKNALQTEKMNLVGQLAGSIAHEIRNPLTSLKGFVQLFRSGTVPLDTYLHIMEGELQRIEEISGELLGFVRPSSSQFQLIDVGRLVSDVQILLETIAFSNRISLQISPISKPLYMMGVTSQLKQVLINLLKNSIEAMPNGGVIGVTMIEKNDQVLIRISDEGIGMSHEQLERLGEPFHTTKEQGTGLGLSVCYRIIDNHQGQLSVESTLGVGTTFTLQLPSKIATSTETIHSS